MVAGVQLVPPISQQNYFQKISRRFTLFALGRSQMRGFPLQGEACLVLALANGRFALMVF